uniref:Uncharacterized protein n=1 Tax=Aegilops tauschii subsp. strangulata TaxID=200361 RepID=A0A453Q174_AEGTS
MGLVDSLCSHCCWSTTLELVHTFWGLICVRGARKAAQGRVHLRDTTSQDTTAQNLKVETRAYK